MLKKHYLWGTGLVVLLAAVLGFVIFEDRKPQVKLSGSRDHKIDQIITATNFKGTAMVLKPGQAPDFHSVGYGNAAKQELNTPDTVFAIASVEKTMTAAMIMQLIVAKKLSFTTKLAHFYPQIPGASQVTMRQLLDHQSGYLTDEIPLAEQPQSEKGAIAFAISQINDQTSQAFQYDNANYVLLAGIIRQVTGKSFAANLQQRIIQPLKLQHTFNFDQIPPMQKLALPYAKTSRRDYHPAHITPKLYGALLGAGNLFMSIRDLTTFMASLHNGQVLTASQFQTLTKRNADSNYAAGWFALDNGDLAVMGMYDDYPGTYQAYVAYNHHFTTGVILLANQSTDVALQDLGDELMGLN
ncbi:conserved hypothetical penicillin-binding protein [Agrilactobacillus composti DSM 18527 = JCM 14202]|uniref:Conserved hypothetical penicillin-binding protein n=1 Tax=Agrilactobacillus composti DSM 18527 = JCM 14202 TaxID=1423734 RepID=A0A0R1Y624_9LACO|nr:serine hydrolase domain-containing protein [Agrilactobacillus composti]KRM36260.1 conserved hypothetical penicillin-binding protein [Agrilactobacillus composti DSM 18527 = JCM 14202]